MLCAIQEPPTQTVTISGQSASPVCFPLRVLLKCPNCWLWKPLACCQAPLELYKLCEFAQNINPCGPYYMTIGDAGNIEGLTAYFVNATTCQRALKAGGDACAPSTCTPAMYNQPIW